MIITDKALKEYTELFPEGTTFEEISKQLQLMKKGKKTNGLRKILCNELTYYITTGYRYYPKMEEYRKAMILYPLLKKNIKMLSKEESFYWMLLSLYEEDNKGLYDHFDNYVLELEDVCSSRKIKLNEVDLIEELIEPMKNAVPGFWDYAQKKISPCCQNDGTHELCALMDSVYSDKSDEERVDILTEFLRKYPDITIAKEYLAAVYGNLKMWKNQIACLEGIKEPLFFANCMVEYYFQLGFAYYKIKDYKGSETNYKKAMEIDESYMYLCNNYGYVLYRQKKYSEAEIILKKCLENGWDLSYSANNYVRVLIAAGKNKEAKEFVKSAKYNISKSFIKKVNDLPDKNSTAKKVSNTCQLDEDEEMQSSKTILPSNTQQFTSEKILEDELTNRIESGIPVFGKKLKMYNKKGEYGRQYIIPVGRLDLLCEDDEKNLYIIELKKDSGYDDAYSQIVDYIEWFKKSRKFKGRNIYGIICLNNPSKKLIDNVRSDERVQLFEYQISYNEIV